MIIAKNYTFEINGNLASFSLVPRFDRYVLLCEYKKIISQLVSIKIRNS